MEIKNNETAPVVATPAVTAETTPTPTSSTETKQTLGQKVMNVLQANTIIQSLTADNKSLLARLEEKENEVNSMKQLSSDWSIQIEGIEQLKKSYDKQIEDLKKNVTTAEASSGVKAIKILANAGVPIDDVPAITSTKKTLSPEETLEQFNKLKGSEQTTFYNEHRDTILKQTGLKKY